MQIERDDLLKQTKKIIKHLRVSGGIFGDSNITSEDNIYRSMSKSLVPMGGYCEDNITVVYGYIKGFQEALEYTNNQ
ncbi:hypothetical protein SPONN_1771 [uncultured Candidatus Thioglobus sp.]|nr:hypothetical protein SPONN_1771 [uncultured Candidatus Thioglobus sp.]